jgi:Flp pilus assembly protein TadD
MFTTAGERSGRETVKYFEQVHGFFVQAMGAIPGKALPVRIIGFNSRKEYEPYRLNNFATAFYHGTQTTDYIVLGQVGPEVFPVAVHEYVHLVARHAGLKFPPWLNEGLAEFYSTLKPLGDKIILGDLIPGRYQFLLREKWVPLAVILKADHNSPYYNEKNQAGNLYNEGWALVHMLVLTNEYRSGFSKFLREMSGGTPSEEALLKIYGKTVEQVDKELQAYLHGSQFKAVVVPQKLEKVNEDIPAEPAAPFDVKLVLADLQNRPGKEQEARAAMEQLTVEDPKRPEPFAALAYMEWREKRNDEATKDFGRAFELGDRNPTLLWDYGRLARGRNNAESIRALTALMALEPERLEVRLELAADYLVSRNADATLAVLMPVTKITKEEAPRFFTIKAHAQLDRGLLEDARKSAEALAKFAKTEEEKSQAEQILKYLDARAKGTAPALPGETAEGRPTLQRRPEQKSIAGSFVTLDCSGTSAKMVIETAEGKKILSIDDPHKILGETIELTCGVQKRHAVRVEFISTDQAGVDGVVRRIEFEP